jgi:flagellar P-ring protein precursor FlgI
MALDRNGGARRAAPLSRVSLCALCALWLALFALPAHAERIRDLATIQGVRPNQLVGYGLVVGLDGTGDQTTQTPFTVQSLQSMLGQLGINIPPGTQLQLKNVAAVMVTAQLPSFARPGQLVDVTVSSLGNARSLRGGTLVLTPLKGADGQVYAMAQGNVAIAGAGAQSGGNKVQINQLNAGRIPNGATVERAVASPLATSQIVALELTTTDFDAARRIVEALNRRFGEVAAALDGRVIQVRAPQDPNARVAFLAELESIDVGTPNVAAKVILNARTGSIVMNQAVTLEPCAVAHGSLSVVVTQTPIISQPNAFAAGQTVVAEQTDIQIKQESGALMLVPAGAKLADIVKALNALGANPQDLISILQSMKAAGALRAELEII